MTVDATDPDSGGADVGRDQDSDLDIMAPLGRPVKCGVETIVVTPLTIGQLPGFMRCLRRTNIDLASGEIDALALIDDNGEAVIEAVAVAVGRPVEDIQAFEADVFIDLTVAVIEVNADFFVQRLAGRIPTLLGSLSRTLLLGKTPGRSSSANSFEQATRTIQ